MKIIRTFVLLALVSVTPSVGLAEDTLAQNQAVRARMGEIKDNQTRFNNMVDKSAAVYKALSEGKQGQVPDQVLKNAHCIAVLPDVGTGALLIGGTHGSGLVSCKKTDMSWSQPAAITLNQGSIGLQAGAKSADLVLFFQNEPAVSALKRGEFALGTDVSAVAGNFDTQVDTSTVGVIVYTRSAGLFAGASINSGKMSKDQTELDSYYGKKTDYLALLEGRETPDTTGYSKKLIELFP